MSVFLYLDTVSAVLEAFITSVDGSLSDFPLFGQLEITQIYSDASR